MNNKTPLTGPIFLDATKFILLRLYSYRDDLLRICSKSLPKSAKSPLPVDVRRSKSLLLPKCLMTTSTALRNGFLLHRKIVIYPKRGFEP